MKKIVTVVMCLLATIVTLFADSLIAKADNSSDDTVSEINPPVDTASEIDSPADTTSGINPFEGVGYDAVSSINNAAIVEDESQKVIFMSCAAGDAEQSEGENAADQICYYEVKDVNIDEALAYIRLNAKVDENTEIEVRKDSLDGVLVDTFKLDATNGEYQDFHNLPYKDNKSLRGVSNYYFICKNGSCYISSWKAQGSNSVPPEGSRPPKLDIVGKKVYDTVEAESMPGVSPASDREVVYASIDEDRPLEAVGVNFDEGVSAIELSLRTRYRGTVVEIHLDSPEGQLIGRIKVDSPSFVTAKAYMHNIIRGFHNVYFVAGNEVDVDSWKAYPISSPEGSSYEELGYKTTPMPVTGFGKPFYIPYHSNSAVNGFARSENLTVGENNGHQTLENLSGGDYFTAKDAYFDAGSKGFYLIAKCDEAGIVDITTDKEGKNVLGSMQISETGGKYTQFSADMENLEGMHDIAIHVRSGKITIDSWRVEPLKGDSILPELGQYIDPYYHVEAEIDYPRKDAEVETIDGSNYVTIKEPGGYFSVENLLFPLDLLELHVYAKSDGDAELEIRDGAVDGPLVGKIQLHDTGEKHWEDFSVKEPVFNKIMGSHTFYFVSTKGSFSVNSWKAVGDPRIIINGIKQQEPVEEPETTEQPEVTETPETTEQPEVSETPEVTEQPEETNNEDTSTTAESNVEASYVISHWTNGYQVNVTIKNIAGKNIHDWKFKVKKSEIDLDSSWCANVSEEGDYYVFSAPDWGKILEPGQEAEFGFIGKGRKYNPFFYTVE